MSFEHRGLTRRDFLVASAAAALAPAGCRRPPYRAQDFELPRESPIVALWAESYDVDFSVVIGHGLRELQLDVRDKRVLLKPNLVEYEPGTVINTHPQVVVGAAVAFLRAGAREVVIAEGPGHRRDLEYLLSSTGMLPLLHDERLPFVDLNHDDVQAVRLRSWFTGLDELTLPTALLQSDLVVSMPKLKTHHWAGITCSMKNLFGVVPGAVYGWPKNVLHYHGIESSILDLVSTVRPHLAIVDGVIGMEGDGPIMGQPKPANVILMGRDLVAVDASAARIMGLRPEGIKYLPEAARFLGNLDPARIPMRGERLERFVSPFEVLPALAALRA